jgi:hypothetical protein
VRNPFARPATATEVTELREQVTAERNNVELLRESIAELEARLSEPGWQRLFAQADLEFSRDGLRQIAAGCRLYAIKHPLIKRGLGLRTAYVWGQGVEVTARATGSDDGDQDVNTVVQEFWDDEGNARSFTGSVAQQRAERSLFTDGNWFLAAFTLPRTGKVQVRTLPFDEVADIIRNPDDRSEPWYYLRRWVEETVGADGRPTAAPREAYYPDLDYRPQARPRRIGDVEVRWDSPVLHVKVNDDDGWRFGIGDAYAAIDWAGAYREFLTDWARLMRALSRIAWAVTTPGRAQAQARAKIAAAPSANPATGEPNAAGATALLNPGSRLEAVSKSGATLDSESGRPLAMMVAAALDVPVTMLLSDPGQTGARAVAETLDQPTELAMGMRREVWTEAIQRLCRYVVREAVRAPQGPLRGSLRRDEYGRETLTLAGGGDTTIDVTFPDLDDVDPATVVKAVVEAAGTGTVPPDLVLRLLLTALGVRDTDQVIARMTDDDGTFLWPVPPPLGGPGGQAAGLDRGGGDPADAGMGRMADDDPDDDLDDPGDPDEEGG